MSEKKIESLINKLDTKKANSPDDIRNLLLKNLSKNISRSLLLLFNQSLIKVNFQHTVNKVTEHKSKKEGDKAAINLYRPIKCLCCLSKVFKKLYSTNITRTFKKHFTIASLDFGLNFHQLFEWFAFWTDCTIKLTKLDMMSFRFLSRFPEGVRSICAPKRCW